MRIVWKILEAVGVERVVIRDGYGGQFGCKNMIMVFR